MFGRKKVKDLTLLEQLKELEKDFRSDDDVSKESKEYVINALMAKRNSAQIAYELVKKTRTKEMLHKALSCYDYILTILESDEVRQCDIKEKRK